MLDAAQEAWDGLPDGGFCFVNLVDFDTEFGHRRDIPGYAAALEAFDRRLPHIEAALGKGIVDPELIQKALVSPASKFEIDPRKIIAPARAMQAYQVKLGSLEKELPFDGLFETQYYERALKSGS